MSKIFKFKSWLTLRETASRLTKTLGEPVSEADCLQLAIDGHITISVLLGESRYAILSEVTKTTQRELFENWIVSLVDGGAIIRTPAGDEFYQDAQLDFEYETVRRKGYVFSLDDGVYDLPMIGAEMLDVMHKFDLKQSLHLREFCNIEGPFLKTPHGLVNLLNTFNKLTFKADDDGNIRKYDEKNDAFVDFSLEGYSSFFYPDDGLGNVDFVFRNTNIELFEKKALEESDDSLALDESLLIIGSILNAIKKTQITSKRWTQDALKSEMIENDGRISSRLLDDYFSKANKAFKSNS